MVIKLLKFYRQNHAVNQVISILLIVGLVASSMAGIVFWAMPLIDEKKMESEIQTTIYSFEMLDSTIKNMLIEGYSASRIAAFMCPNDKGSLEILSSTDKLIVMYAYDSAFDFDVSDLDDEDTDFSITMTSTGTFEEADIYFLNPSGDYDPPDLSGTYIVPTDYDTSELKPVVSGAVTTTNNLEGSLLIDLYDTDIISDGIPEGRIWVFDLGSVNYNAYYSPGNQKTVYQNGAIFSMGFDDRGVINKPSLITVDEVGDYAISLRVIQIEGSLGVGGRSTPRLGLDLKNNFKRDQPIGSFVDVDGLKFQFFGVNKQTWINYFISMDDLFEIGLDANTVNCKHDDVVFILDSSLVEINVG